MSEDEEGKVQASLSQLSAADRRLAAAQGYCPIQPDNRLGAMGVPVKVMAKGQPVFLCCIGCKADALKDPDRTLAAVERVKAKAPAAPRGEGGPR